MRRCADCFEVLAAGGHFEVLRRMRDLPSGVDPIEARQLQGMLYDAVPLCRDCAGWYRDVVRVGRGGPLGAAHHGDESEAL